MSKETDMKQMWLLGDSLANPSQSQGKEKEQMTTDISGMKLLESSENVNPDGLLGKMLKALLTSKKAWYSDRCKTIWKERVSKSSVLLFQLQASVLGIKEKESGLSDIMYPTPTQDSASERTKKYKQGGTPLPMAVKMFPTPTVGCEEGGEQSERVEQTKSGGFLLRKKNNPNMTYGAKLSDAMIYLEKNKIYNRHCQPPIMVMAVSTSAVTASPTMKPAAKGTTFSLKKARPFLASRNQPLRQPTP